MKENLFVLLIKSLSKGGLRPPPPSCASALTNNTTCSRTLSWSFAGNFQVDLYQDGQAYLNIQWIYIKNQLLVKKKGISRNSVFRYFRIPCSTFFLYFSAEFRKKYETETTEFRWIPCGIFQKFWRNLFPYGTKFGFPVQH